MKTALKLILLFTLLITASCAEETDNLNETDNIEVKTYISLLKADQYTDSELPLFKRSDIPELLKYIDDNQLITVFPQNYISSYYMHDCRVGMVVLWTIESVRAQEINSKYLIGRFPSQNPLLQLKNTPSFYPVNDDVSHHIASEAYKKWWNSPTTLTHRMQTDPLEDTSYKWH